MPDLTIVTNETAMNYQFPIVVRKGGDSLEAAFEGQIAGFVDPRDAEDWAVKHAQGGTINYETKPLE